MAGKKTGKRLLTWVLVLVMALSLLPLNVLADEAGETQDVIQGYYDQNGVWTAGTNSPDLPNGVDSVNKTAKRVGDNTYEVTLEVVLKETITNVPSQAATVLVIDTSGSMGCQIEEHEHNLSCIILGCSEEEHTHSPACDCRLKDAKAAAIDFLDSYKAGGTGRYVALVRFSTDAEVAAAGWQDVSTDAGYNAILASINNLSAGGGTNLEQGLAKAQDLLGNSTIPDTASKNIIALTDGEPTYYNAPYPHYSPILGLYEGTYPDGDGQNCDENTFKATQNKAAEIHRNGYSLYSICFGAANEEVTNPYTNTNITLFDYLNNYIAPGKTYSANDFNGLKEAFAAISENITTGLSSGTVHDSLPTGVTSLEIPNRAVEWDLNTFDKKTSTNGPEGNTTTTYTYTKTYIVTIDPTDEAVAGKDHYPLNGPTTLTVGDGVVINFPIPAGLVTVPSTPNPTPATVTLSDANGNALIKKHLTVNGDGLAEDTYFVAKLEAVNDLAKGVLSGSRSCKTGYMIATGNDVFTFDNTNDGNILTFSAPGEYTFKVTEENLSVKYMQYDDTEYTMTVKVEKDESENKLNATVSFKNGDDPVNEGYITFNNTYTAPTYPVYVYAFFAHNGKQLTDNVTVNGKPIEWNEDANNEEYKEYFVTLGVYKNGTTKEPTDGATGLVLKDLNVTEYEAAEITSQGNGTKNDVTLNDITVFPSPSGKVCKGAAGYPDREDILSWHLDGQVDVYTVTYDYNGGTAQGAPTSDGYYFGSYTIAAAPKRDGYTFTGWKDGDTTYQAGQEITLKKDLKLVAQWTARTDLSYTVNYLEKDTNIVLHEKKIQTGVTFGAEIDSADEIITINGYNYDSADKDKLTIGTDESKNVINIYYTKRTDLSYTVHYYLKNTTKPVANDKRVNGQTFNAVVKEEAIRISGYRVYGDSEKSITIGTGTNEIIFYYTRASRPSTPSKPTLNTGDHYAYVMGYPDGTVRPNGSITRAEVSAILFRLLSDKTRDEYFTTESSFTDVKAGAWYNNSIATLEKAGVIVDTAKGGAFRPNEAITRAELAAMLAQFSDAKPVKGVKFSDVSAEHWAYEAIAIAAKMGWIEGYPDGTFRPDATITRAEMMTLVNRALERVPSDEDHLLSKRVMLTFPDCKSGDWFYIAVQEATNSHTYERAATEKNGDEQWTALRANRDWTLLEK